MTKKQKSLLTRIILGIVLFLAGMILERAVDAPWAYWTAVGLLLALLGGRRNASPPAEAEETERPPYEGGCPRSGLGGQIPFGPAVSLAAWPVVLFGAQALRWYMGLFAW